MPTDAPTPDELAAIRARHRPTAALHPRGRVDCAACSWPWPCDAARLLAALDRETAHWRAAEDDLARVSAARDALADRAEAAEIRLTASDGHTLVVTAAELWASRREGRELYERAQFWAAGWRRAAKGWRDGALRAVAWHAQTNERLEDVNRALDALRAEHDAWLARAARAGMFPAEVAAVVAAARAVVRDAGWLERSTVLGLHALIDALGALDAATNGEES